MPKPIRAKFRLILPTIKARLMAKLSFPSERVLIVARQRVPHFQGDQDVLVWISGNINLNQYSDGAGPVDTRVRRIVHVIPRTRLALDTPNSDEIWLCDPNLGHLELEDKCLAALHIPADLWVPGDTATKDEYLDEPSRLVNSDLPQKEDQGLRDAAAGQWGFSVMAFEFVWVPDLPQQ